MQNLPTFQRCTFGICELCGGFSHRGGVAGLVKDRSGQDVMPVRQVFICDPCLEQIGTVEENEQKIKDELLEDCLAPLEGFGKLEQIEIDGGEIQPDAIRPKVSFRLKDGKAYFKGVIEIKPEIPCELTKEQIAEMAKQAAEESMNRHKHLLEDLFVDVHVSFKTDNELMTEVKRLRKLVEIERSARSDLERIREKFADDPLLRGIYSSSTQYVFDQVTRAIDETFGVLLGEGEDE